MCRSIDPCARFGIIRCLSAMRNSAGDIVPPLSTVGNMMIPFRCAPVLGVNMGRGTSVALYTRVGHEQFMNYRLAPWESLMLQVT